MNPKDAAVQQKARALYEAYAESTGWKSAVTGSPLPPFDSCSAAVRLAWEAAARAASRDNRERRVKTMWEASAVLVGVFLRYGLIAAALALADGWVSVVACTLAIAALDVISELASRAGRRASTDAPEEDPCG